MAVYPRCGIYFAPAPGSPWWEFGCRWLGRDAVSGKLLDPPAVDGFGRGELLAITESPRLYGFHGTLKAPFALAEGRSIDHLLKFAAQFARRQVRFPLPQLQVQTLGGFVALVPAQPSPELADLASRCVVRFDRFRAPPEAADLARRLAAGLTPRQESLLRAWGYPYVLDQFRFHLTLSGKLPQAQRLRVMEAVRPLVDKLNGAPPPVDGICLFEQATPGAPFQVLARIGFDGSTRVYRGGPAPG